MEWVRAEELLRAAGGDPRITSSPAILAILSRARQGLMRARAAKYVHDNNESLRSELKREFWLAEGHDDLHQNWTTGDFAWKHTARTVAAFGVSFSKDDAEAMGIKFNISGSTSTGKKLDGIINKGGPARSDKWNDFMAELCHHLHYRGIPDGDGTQGIDKLIVEIQSKLIKKGLDALDRSTVQGVVGTVLKRLREGA